MKKFTDMIRNLMLGATFIIMSLLYSCTEEYFMGTPNDITPVPISGELCFSLKLSTYKNNGITRIPMGNDEEAIRPGVKNENTIHSVSLFFEDLDNKGNPIGTKPMVYFQVPYPGKASDGLIKLRINQGGSQQLTTGPKKLYIGVNLSKQQSKSFAEGNKEYAITDPNIDYGHLTEEYAPGKGIGLLDNPDKIYTRDDIAMFCTDGQLLILTEDNKEYVCEEQFKLKKNVAKILVLCKIAKSQDIADGAVPGVDYCVTTKGLKDRGWIRQRNVRFLINGLNRKSYIMQKATWITDKQLYYYEDPNNNLQDNIYIGDDGISVPQNLKNNFLYHAVQTLNKQSQFFAKTLPYIDSRMPNGTNDATCYFEGLYCPENTFNLALTDEANKIILANYNYPWPMITHVSITAKFTPKDLLVEKDMSTFIDQIDMPELTPNTKDEIKRLIENGTPHSTIPEEIIQINSSSEAISWAILTASLKHHNMLQSGQIYEENNPGFPENTYLSVANEHGNTEFYTYGAAKTIAIKFGKWTEGTDSPKELASFKAMPRGRGYYYTYVDNRKVSDKKETTSTYEDGQVERNIYYILTVNAFATPGRTGSEPEYIKVHTSIDEWKNGGNANVELD